MLVGNYCWRMMKEDCSENTIAKLEDMCPTFLRAHRDSICLHNVSSHGPSVCSLHCAHNPRLHIITEISSRQPSGVTVPPSLIC
jgi:hypothetical protein